VPPQKQRTPQLRHHLLDVAVDLLGREGPSAFTTRRLAREAGTSTPAVYELFGDKRGLLREVYFEGFRALGDQLRDVPATTDPLADLRSLARRYRTFLCEHPELADVMFSRPFTVFDPGPSELRTTASVRELIVARVRRCMDAGSLVGDETDIAHVLVALVQGMAGAENARRLGTTSTSIERRWSLALEATLSGLGPRPGDPRSG